MNALKQRPVALAITVVLVIAAVLGGSHRSLARERGKVEQLLETGVGDSGSILADRQEQMKICANLASVAERYSQADKAASLRKLAQTAQTDPAGEEYDAARALADELLTALEGTAGLSEQDADYVISFRSQLASYDMIIARNGYNEKARTFNEKVLAGFPASLLGRLTGVKPLEVFE